MSIVRIVYCKRCGTSFDASNPWDTCHCGEMVIGEYDQMQNEPLIEDELE